MSQCKKRRRRKQQDKEIIIDYLNEKKWFEVKRGLVDFVRNA